MGSVREQVLQRFPGRGVDEPDDQLAHALYALLWQINDVDVDVDGWGYFHVVRESSEFLDVVGLMTLLPERSVPIQINLKGHEGGFGWSVQVGRLDSAWLALSDSKQWMSVYLYATGGRESPGWRWGPWHHGSLVD
jgi:hypothetical protein